MTKAPRELDTSRRSDGATTTELDLTEVAGGGPAAMPDAAEIDRWSPVTPMLYPSSYVWFVFVSSLDVMLTWAILTAGGSEVNPIANRVIELWGLPGAIGFKFSITIFVILVCEVVGRAQPRTGRALAALAVLISSVPVVYSLGLLFIHVF